MGLTQTRDPEPGDGHNLEGGTHPGGGHGLEEAPTIEGDHADEGLALEEGLTLGRASPWMAHYL